MANDLMGELGLDTEQFEQAIDRCSKRTEGRFVGAMKKAASALGFAFGAVAVTRYVTNLRNLGNEIDSARAKLIAGSEDAKKFEDAVGGSGGAEFTWFARMGKAYDNLMLKAKKWTAESALGLRLAGEDAGNAVSRMMLGENAPQTHEVRDQIEYDKGTAQIYKDILQKEDRLAETRKKDTAEIEVQLDILMQEQTLAEQRLALAERKGISDREAANSAKDQLGQIQAQLKALDTSYWNEVEALKAQTREMELQRAGFSALGDISKRVEELENKRVQALREGKKELAEQYKIQQKIAVQDFAIAEHNMTPKQRREERAAARKRARDVKKTEAHEQDLANRLQQAEAQGNKITPGSELDRFRKRRDAARAGRMKVANAAPDPVLADAMNKEGLIALKSIDTKMGNAFLNR